MSLGTLSRHRRAIADRATGGLLALDADVAADGRAILSRRRQRFPLRITTPLYLDPALPKMAFVYIQNPTGGLFEDDDLTITLTAHRGTLVHLTTQSASKVYRASMECARQRVNLRVSAGAFVEYVPDPLIPHAGARFEQQVAAEVEPDGALIVAETVTPGRVASGEAFAYSSLSLSTRISSGGTETAVDSVLLRPHERDPRCAGILGGYAYLASLFAVASEPDSKRLTRKISDAVRGVSDCLVGVGTLPSSAGVLVRILAKSAIPAQRVLETTWSAARLVLVGAPPPPRRK